MLEIESLPILATGAQTPKIKACLITNPRSGRGGIDLTQVLPILKAHGWDVTVRSKLKGGMATTLARQAAEEGFDVVINGGGDGTLREIVTGLLGTNVALGCLPGGTVNLWTKELGISPRLEVAARQLIGSVRRKVDIGQVKINGGKSHHFLLMAGLGFDGTVMGRVSKPLKNRVGRLAVGLAGLLSLPSFAPATIQAEIGDLHWSGRVAQLVVGNTRLYGGFTRLTPQALADDGMLDLCLLTALDPLSLAGQLYPLLVKHEPNPQSAELYRAGRLSISSPKPLPLQLDGGALKYKKSDGVTTYAFSVIAKGVTTLVPATYNGHLFSRKNSLPAFIQGEYGSDEVPDSPKDKSTLRLEVSELGVNLITGVRTKNGKVFLVELNADTVLDRHGALYKNITPIMAALEPGDILEVNGARGALKGRILARRLTVLSPSTIPASPKEIDG
ncbi:MAG: diacylglycerol kinase family lipid kinase [Chloroflexi bacterium]|nr:diacylglycerol kinase family lipid kinase [Chloroflexota bacterium]OJV97044.1 MAG: hypothetical protein BGO39_18740 [Chloroflexi bacterium 54-19]